MKVLALDVSGTATGWCFAENSTLKEYGKYISPTSGSRGKRLALFLAWLKELLEKYHPDVIAVEKPFLGRNSKVLVNLSKFVAVVEIVSYQVLSLDIEESWFIDPRQIKKLLKVPKIKLKSVSNHDANKKAMVKRINSLYGLQLKYQPGKSKKYCDDDIADSIAVLHAWILLHKEKTNDQTL